MFYLSDVVHGWRIAFLIENAQTIVWEWMNGNQNIDDHHCRYVQN